MTELAAMAGGCCMRSSCSTEISDLASRSSAATCCVDSVIHSNLSKD